MARKNGKTALIAALVLCHLVGPEAVVNGEIYSAANDKEQAGIVFKYVRQIIELSPELTSILEVIRSTKTVVNHRMGASYTALSADAETKHGLNPFVVIYDELAQSKNRDLFDTLDTAQGAQDEPLFFTISTQSNDPQHPLSEMIDDGLNAADPSIVVHLYEMPEEIEDIFDEANWIGPNPALGDFRSLPEIQSYARRAKRLPSMENAFRNLYLNQRVSLQSTLFSRTVWLACAGQVEFKPGEELILALDLATTTDLAALAVTDIEGTRLDCYFWKPEDLLEEHGRRDRQNYAVWYNQGLLEPCPGKTIDTTSIAMKIAGLMSTYRIAGLAYDRWRIANLIKDLDRIGVDASDDENASLQIVPWGQGFKDMSPAIDAFETKVIEGVLTHSNNPVLNWNIANAIVSSDPAGNRKLDKAKSRMRIDGAQASAMALGLVDRWQEESRDSIYRTMKPLVL